MKLPNEKIHSWVAGSGNAREKREQIGQYVIIVNIHDRKWILLDLNEVWQSQCHSSRVQWQHQLTLFFLFCFFAKHPAWILKKKSKGGGAICPYKHPSLHITCTSYTQKISYSLLWHLQGLVKKREDTRKSEFSTTFKSRKKKGLLGMLPRVTRLVVTTMQSADQWRLTAS